MDVNRAVVPDVLIAPHHIEQVLPAVHPAGVAHEQLHQVELLGGEVHRDPVLPGGTLIGVQTDVAHGKGTFGRLALHRRTGTAQQGADPRLQLQDVEGLGDVVVRPALKAHDLVRVLPLGGEHDDRDVGELPDAHTGLEPIDLGHHQIQDDQVKVALPGQLHGFLPVIAGLYLIALIFQVKGDPLYQDALVVHDQYFCHSLKLLLF